MKKYIKMNNNDEHLSLGNLFRLIKDSSKNKISALQSELFCILFDLESINDTTINNYCVGCRSIGGEFKQIYINKEKKYLNKEKEVFVDNIIGILNVIDGIVYTDIKNKIDFINNNESAKNLVYKLYNLAKNDRQVIKEFTNKLYKLINNNKVYDCLVELLIFVVLKKKQPVYEEELKIEVFEDVLKDTSISSYELQEYLSLKLREGINFDYSMKKIAEKGNTYANFEIGSNEYYGYVKGVPRYEEAYIYLSKAAEMDHAGANYMIGNMLIKGNLGNRSDEDFLKGYEYLKKSYNLGNIASANLIGNMYLNGIYPLNKDLEKARKYYEEAKISNYVFAYNNLGKLEEENGNLDNAFNYYKYSADLGESWACNKVGEFYRLGILKQDLNKAYIYYNKAIEANYRTICYYSYYNLAKYFYLNGCSNVVIKDELKALEYLIVASDNNIIEASVELFYYYSLLYLNKKDDSDFENLLKYKKRIELHEKYNDDLRDKIEFKLKELSLKKEIDINCILGVN